MTHGDMRKASGAAALIQWLSVLHSTRRFLAVDQDSFHGSDLSQS